MKKALGILGGMGPLATVDLYKKIVLCTRAECDFDHIRIYIDNNTDIPDRASGMYGRGPSPVPAMTDSIRKLEACGAGCIIMPCNTAHYYYEELSSLSNVPIISITDATASYCKERFPGKTAYVLATVATFETKLYDKALSKAGVPFLIPEKEDMLRLNRIIYDGVKAGLPTESLREDWDTVLSNGRARGADYFILGCTELPVVAEELHSEGDFADSNYALAKAAIEYCGYEVI